MRKIGDRGQINMSFGMIFSIILIILFLAFAFYAIKKLLDIQEKMTIANFIDDLSTDVDEMWKGSQGSQPKTYNLPKKIEYVCFIDFATEEGSGEYIDFYEEINKYFKHEENMVFYPLGSSKGLKSEKIEHIDLEKITQENNPYCIKNNKRKVKITIKKDFEEDLVIISE